MTSIIVPVYNAEKYLDAAIDSVQAQTSSDWELILIDDCSTDGSLMIAKARAESDSRIRIFSTGTNSGPARARNIGMDNARGDYLAFLDSDDTLKPNFLERMVDAAEKYDADIVWCQYDMFSPGNSPQTVTNSVPKGNVVDKSEAVRLLFHNEPGTGSLWNKLFKNSLFHTFSLRLNEKRVRAEDWEFVVEAFGHVERMVAISDSLYNYIRQNPSSVMAAYRPTDFPLMCRSVRILKEISEKNGIIPPKGFFGSTMPNFVELAMKAAVADRKNARKLLRDIKKSEEYRFVAKDSGYSHLSKTYLIMARLIDISPALAVFFAITHNTVKRLA